MMTWYSRNPPVLCHCPQKTSDILPSLDAPIGPPVPSATHPLSALLAGPGLCPPLGCLCLQLLLSRMVVLNKVVLPRGHVAISGNIFGCHNLGVAGKGGCHGHLVCGGHPATHRTCPHHDKRSPVSTVPHLRDLGLEGSSLPLSPP